MIAGPAISQDVLRIDAASESSRIEAAIRDMVFQRMRRKGIVVGLSGGVDSSTVAALSVRALGRDRVLGLMMPESESSGDSLELGRLVAGWLGIDSRVEDVSPVLAGAGCYRRRDEAIRSLIPRYGEGCKCKIAMSDVVSGNSAYSYFFIVVQFPDGTTERLRLTAEAYLAVVAASNFKQRARKMIEYYYADLLSYAVAGTPNRLEYDQGFFVKNGDGAADLKPIAHLYKSQVYQIARHLGVPAAIIERTPTTDTYSLEQTQEEFFFALPSQTMDLCLYARDCGIEPQQASQLVGLTPEQVSRVYRMIDSKRRTTRYLHLPPLLIEPVHIP
jgi:NAD+ synthase